MKKQFSLSQFKKWKKAFLDNMSAPFITESALIELSELEAFLTDIKKLKADSVRVCFLRFKDDVPQEENAWRDGAVLKGCIWEKTDTGLTQVAVALIPTKNFHADEELINVADDIIVNKRILVLMPGGEKKGPTGHNPPRSKSVSTEDS